MQLNIECKYKVGDIVYIYTLNNIYPAKIKDITCVSNTDESGGYIIKYQCSYFDDKIIEHFSENQLYKTEEEAIKYKKDVLLSQFYSICKKYNSLQNLQLNIDKNDLPTELHSIYMKIFELQNNLFGMFNEDETINENYKFDCTFFNSEDSK